ncbi:MAG: GAF domain-containing protein [Planctomycetota bacterium]
MISAPFPQDESLRLLALQRCQLLDTTPETFFDGIVRLAAAHFAVPIALVSLVDTDRQWFKAKHGLDAVASCRDHAFCAHAILQDDILEIPDAREDERFHDNPFVTDAPHIRFYAGCPLTDENGYRLGTLCLIDAQPRTLSDDQRTALRLMAQLVSDHIQIRDLLNTFVGEPATPPNPSPFPLPIEG